MNATALSEAIAPLNLRSCLVSLQGRLVFEHYRDARAASEIGKINSCTKSVLSALLCIAMGRGLLPEPETPVAAFFPSLARSPDPRKRSLTLWHLLTMSAGFEWTEFGGRNSFPRMTRSPNWIEFVLELPLSDEPGTRMTYNSGASQLLSAILSQAAGMTTARFAESHLFGPLGIDGYAWETDPQGVHTGGFGLQLRPRDLLKFGLLYLQGGCWNGRPIISPALVERSVQPAFRSGDHREGWYGWHWWADRLPRASSSAHDADLPYFFARGYGGQYVYVIPGLEAVVVLTDDKRKRDRQSVDVFCRLLAPLLAP